MPPTRSKRGALGIGSLGSTGARSRWALRRTRSALARAAAARHCANTAAWSARRSASPPPAVPASRAASCPLRSWRPPGAPAASATRPAAPAGAGNVAPGAGGPGAGPSGEGPRAAAPATAASASQPRGTPALRARPRSGPAGAAVVLPGPAHGLPVSTSSEPVSDVAGEDCAPSAEAPRLSAHTCARPHHARAHLHRHWHIRAEAPVVAGRRTGVTDAQRPRRVVKQPKRLQRPGQGCPVQQPRFNTAALPCRHAPPAA